ncbi:hypothetical protein EDD18DRAFT_1362750 [Armillaria luteobubalina]|uniref:Uncharacterized protein n=1 Tax=Armillaria luteobubalina TaxID=153913 RepID=A0AA39UCZ8_9AGAR|nr:hypothetical protein EDD18DRAFT_1362750 [Armillaria luteobubalina]
MERVGTDGDRLVEAMEVMLVLVDSVMALPPPPFFPQQPQAGPQYMPMPPGPICVDLPQEFNTLLAILRENRLAQLATVDQQRELMQNEIRGVIARVEQLGNEIHGLRSGGRPLSDGSSGSSSSDGSSPGRGQLPFPVQMPGMLPGFVPDGQQGPPGPQMPQPVVPEQYVINQPAPGYSIWSTRASDSSNDGITTFIYEAGSPSSSSASTSHSSRSGSGSPRSDASSPSVVHYVPAPGAVPYHTGTDVSRPGPLGTSVAPVEPATQQPTIIINPPPQQLRMPMVPMGPPGTMPHMVPMPPMSTGIPIPQPTVFVQPESRSSSESYSSPRSARSRRSQSGSPRSGRSRSRTRSRRSRSPSRSLTPPPPVMMVSRGPHAMQPIIVPGPAPLPVLGQPFSANCSSHCTTAKEPQSKQQ